MPFPHLPEQRERVKALDTIMQAETHGRLPSSSVLQVLKTILILSTPPKIMLDVTMYHQLIHLEMNSRKSMYAH